MEKLDHDIITPYGDKSLEKKQQVNNMFDKIAPYYDFLNRFLSLGVDVYWRKKAISFLQDKKQDQILDIATGTADLAIEMAHKLDAKKIVGMDLSQKMIDIGVKKLAKKSLVDKIKLETGDSENLRYEDASFDIVTAAFGVRNFENLNKGLEEMYRVLKKDGTLMILEFSKPRIFPFKQIFNAYFKYLLPVVGKITSKDPKAYKYLYESVQAFPDYDNFGEILNKIGFQKVNWKPLSLGICTIYIGEK